MSRNSKDNRSPQTSRNEGIETNSQLAQRNIIAAVLMHTVVQRMSTDPPFEPVTAQRQTQDDAGEYRDGSEVLKPCCLLVEINIHNAQ